ncbi:hypothetical protein PMAYCL1PPCAC_07025, partial [Pristionchus mayeri]
LPLIHPFLLSFSHLSRLLPLLFSVFRMGLLDLVRSFKSAPEKEIRILLLGLDNAGKTTLLKKLSSEELTNVTPTKGFNVKTIASGGITLNVWDIGGQRAIRPYWSNYYPGTHAVIYVVDASDVKRLDESHVELDELLEEKKLEGVPLLVLANKQDLSTAADAVQISTMLGLANIRERAWQIQPCVALTGEGVQEGVQWLSNTIKESRK